MTRGTMSKLVAYGIAAAIALLPVSELRAQQTVPQRPADIDVYCEGENSVRLRAWTRDSVCAYFDSAVPHSCRISETAVFIPGPDFSISRVTGIMTDARGRRWACNPYSPGKKKF